MKVTTERTPDCNAIVTVEVDDEQVQHALRDVAQRIARTRQIPGFRPGKAPYEVVARTVGKNRLLDAVIEDLVQSLYKQVLQDENIQPYDTGKADVVQREPLILRFTVPTRPVVTLGDYRSVQLRPPPIVVSDEEVNQVIEQLRQEQVEMTPVTRPVQMGDLVTLDVQGGIAGNAPLESQGLQVRVEANTAVLPWVTQLIGVNANEPRSITYTYPADTPLKEQAGQTATYTVTVTEIKETHLPALDDDFARAISEFQTLDQLKGNIRITLHAQKEKEQEDRFADEVLDAVVEQAQVAFPAVMLQDELDRELAESKNNAQRLGMTWEKYLQLAAKSESAFREQLRPRAEQRLKRLLVLMQLADAEKIEVSDKDVDVEIDRRAEEAARAGGRADQTRRTLSTPDSRRTIEFSIKITKTLRWLVTMARGEPTSGKIITPEMLRAQREAPTPGGLITDPSKSRAAEWPRGLERPVVPGEPR